MFQVKSRDPQVSRWGWSPPNNSLTWPKHQLSNQSEEPAVDSSDPEPSDHSQAAWPRGSLRSEPSTQAVIDVAERSGRSSREEVNTSGEQRYTESAWFSLKD